MAGSELPPSAAPRPPQPLVLVVDDEQVVRDILQRHLSAQGYEVLLAESGEQALQQVRSVQVGLILLDLQMPGMGGLECLKALLAADPSLRVIMLTGVGDDEIATRALHLGARDYFLKPVDLEILKKALKVHFIYSA